MIKYSKRF